MKGSKKNAGSSHVKTLHRKHMAAFGLDAETSLKKFVRSLEASLAGDEQCANWLHNKRVSEKKPCKKIGRTHKSRMGGKKQGS